MSVDVVMRARAGDHDAFAALVRPQLGRLHGLAGLLVHDRSRAEDVVQNALIAAWRDLPKLRDPGRFDAWLHRLVVNASHDEGRRLRRRRAETPLGPQHQPHTRSEIDGLADRDEVVQAFRRLNEKERQVIALRYYADLTAAEAASVLGIREVTYRSKLHRAMRTLQAAMAADARGATRITGAPS